MLPDLALLFALLLGFHWLESADGQSMPDLIQSLGGTAAATLVAAVLCRLSADRTERRMAEDGPEEALAGSRAPMLYPLLAWCLAGFAFRWDALVVSVVPPGWFIAPHLVFFLPLAITTAFAWIAVDRSESAILSRPPSRTRALLSGLRRNAVVLVSVGAVVVIHRTFLTLAALGVPGVRRFLETFRAFPDLLYASIALGVFGAIVISPAVVRRMLRATPLPDGASRTAITRLLATLGVACRDVLLWPTEGRIQNALTVGLFDRTRYIVVSDGLLTAFPTTELLAVVAHEAGHVKHRHLLLHAVSLFSIVLVFLAIGQLLSPWMASSTQATLAILFLWFGWFGLVGRLSRRFEREADAFAADHAGDLAPDEAPVALPGLDAPLPYGATQTVRALQRATRATGAFQRHGSPSVRMAQVVTYATRPDARRDHVEAGRRIRIGIAVLAAAALGLTILRAPGTLARGHADLEFSNALAVSNAADEATKRNDPAALDAHRRARDLFVRVVAAGDARPDDPDMQWLAAVAEFNAADRALRGANDLVAARKGFEKTLERCDKLGKEAGASAIRFAALVDLGRMSLWRTDTPADQAAGLLEAKQRLVAATDLRVNEGVEAHRRARLRLLESSIALRSADAVEADRARRDLAVQAAGTGDERPMWRELADDAREELARVQAATK